MSDREKDFEREWRRLERREFWLSNGPAFVFIAGLVTFIILMKEFFPNAFGVIMAAAGAVGMPLALYITKKRK